MAEDEMYLENLKEFIIEEDKIVTYKWLSRTLSVNVNQAKQMLYAFVQKQNDEKVDNLHIVYIVGGYIKDDSGQTIQKYLFSHAEDLEDIKRCFDHLTSLHIYSVQKTKLKDSNVLYTTDYDLQKQNIECSNRWSNITCKLATKRMPDVEDEPDNNYTANDENEQPRDTKPVNQVPSAPAVSSLPKPIASTSKKNAKSKGKPMKKGDVASFFARQAFSNNKDEKPKDKPKEEEKPSLEKDEATSNNEDKGQNEQNKHDSLSGENNKKEQSDDVKKDEKAKSKTVDEDDNDNNNVNEKLKIDKKTEKKSTPEEKKKENQTKKQKETVDEKPKRGVKRTKVKKSPKEENDENDVENTRKKKKRRRVKNFSDSSSEEEAQVEACNEKQTGGSENSTPIPDQQPEEPMDTNGPAEGPKKTRRRKRVLKSKTYLNDDGYMVTEKVYESESEECSDHEETSTKAPDKVTENKPTSKEVPKKALAKKKTANKPTKQASLTSFFKKS